MSMRGFADWVSEEITDTDTDRDLPRLIAAHRDAVCKTLAELEAESA